MAEQNGGGQSPGGRGAREPAHGGRFSFDDRGAGGDRGGPGGKGRRDDRGGGRGGKFGRDRDGGGAGYRVIADLSTLEKALGKSDLPGEKSALESILKALLPQRLSSLSQLDLNTRGKLLTSLLRVQRQPRPPPSEAGAEGQSDGGTGEVSPSSEAASTVVPPELRAPDQGISEGSPQLTGEQPAEVSHADVSSDLPPNPAALEGTGISEGSPQLTQERAAEKPSAPVDPKLQAWTEVIQLVGRVWRATGEQERAEQAFALTGLPPPPQDAVPARREEPREARAERPGKGMKGERGPRGDRPERAPRGDRPERPARGDRPERPARPDRAARTDRPGPKVERKGAPVPRELAPIPGVTPELQARLHEAIASSNLDAARAILKELPPDSVGPLLEREKSWDLLMEHYIQKADFENVAKLYERARQFDQAALAWERAGRFTPARKAYERVRDLAGANRMREKEVAVLVERGDRLGAATLLLSGGLRKEAKELLEALPPVKAFHFLERVKLEDEAKALAERELAKAEAEQKPAQKARWLEVLGRTQEAAELYLSSGRKDRASPLFEKLGDLPRAAQLAEEAGQHARAVELYRKAGDQTNADRVASLPPPSEPAAPAEPAGEGE